MAKHKRRGKRAAAVVTASPMNVSERAFEDVQAIPPMGPSEIWSIPALPPGVGPPGKRSGKGTKQLAMDAAPPGAAAVLDWAAAGRFHEGIGFLGYAYLAELSQRPEYRRVSEIIASEATRKWVKIRGEDKERVKLVEKQLERFKIRERFRELVELDGFFGRAHLYIDVGVRTGDAELDKPLVVAKEKIAPGSVKNFKVIEPLWSYPGQYNTTSPLAEDFYQPQVWYVMSDTVHASRLLTIVGRPLPDMLKPTYAFGGISLSQMLKPYVDNWLRTRQSVSDLVHSFSVLVLETDMGASLQGGASTTIVNRAKLFNLMRDNRGLLAIGKDKETLTNISTPLGTLDKLLAQSQEQMSSVAGIPLVVLLGITPSGLNASSDGEMRAHYANIKAYQERTCADPFKTVLDVLQLDIDGEIDDTIKFEFLDLWEMDEKDKSLVRKSDADADVALVGAGIVSNEEARERMNTDEEGAYFGVDLSGPAPEVPDDEAELDGLAGANDDDKPTEEAPPRRKVAQDAWDEGRVKRAKDGKFGSGGTGAPKPPGKRKAAAKPLPSASSVRQPAKSHEELAKKGEAARSEFAAKLEGVAQRMGLRTDISNPEDMPTEGKGGFLFVAPNKSQARAEEKVENDYGGDWSQLKDYVRASIAVDTPEQLEQAIAHVKAAGLELAAEPKDKFAKPTAEGYRDRNTLVQLENGMVAELQFHLKEIIKAKAEGHGHYEEQQKLTRKNGSDEPNAKWSERDVTKFNAARAAQQKLYGDAYDRATNA